METKHLDHEIERLNLLNRTEDLSAYGQELLTEFKAIKQALNIQGVSCSGFGKLNKTDNSNDQCSLCKYKSENGEHPACTFCIKENKDNEYYS